MAESPRRPADSYSPLYFLASLGAGGLAVTFFMYLMFWIPKAGKPVPVFEDITGAFANGGLPMQIAIAAAVAGIVVFSFLNIKLLLWNFGALAAFRKTDGYARLRNSNAETALLAAPLASAMTVNALFILGLVFVPGLWGVIEYLFPLALIAFGGLAVWSFALIGTFLGRILSKGGAFDTAANNSFAQLMPAFALAMIAVGLSAPASMSAAPATVAIAVLLSAFVATAAVVYLVIALITAFGSILQHGTAREAGPTLMVLVPLMTVLAIATLRQNHGLHLAFGTHVTGAQTMMILARMLTVQILFVLLGLLVLRRQDYFADFVLGPKTSPGSYALVCPGVALSVMLQFFVNKGLVDAGVIDRFGTAYWAVTALAIGAQLLTVWLVFRLNRQHFAKPAALAPVPAE